MAYDRTTPVIRVRVKLPGKSAPERVAGLDDPAGVSRVISLTYEDTEKAADKAKLRINNYDLRFPDDPTFDRGNMLYLSWGYVGNLSPERELVVVDWLPGPVLEVEAHAKAVVMNRLPVDQTYDGKTYSEVAQLVAERNGYGPTVQFIEPTAFRCETVVQPNLTDAQFMRMLAQEIGYVFFTDTSGFHFHPRAYAQQPRKVLRYFPDGRGELLAYPTFEKAPANKAGAVTLKGIDPITKKPIEARGDNTSTAGRPGLATELEVIDQRTGTTSLRTAAAKERVAATAALNPEEAKAKADGLYKKASGVPTKCSAPCHGDPQMQAKTLVEMQGIGQRLSGLYYVQTANHSVEAGKYTMTLKLTRDGTNGRGGTSAGAAPSQARANTQKAPANPEALEAVETIDQRTGTTSTTYRTPGPGQR